MTSLRTLVVISTRNHRQSVTSLIDEALRVSDVDVTVVDDASPDGTGEAIEALSIEEPRIQVIHNDAPCGMARSVLTGFETALDDGYDRVVQMDADQPQQARDLPEILRAFDEGADVVVGSRYASGGAGEGAAGGAALLRRGASYAANQYARRVLSLDILDVTSGFVGFTCEVIESLIALPALDTDGYGFLIELKYQAHLRGFQLVVVPSQRISRDPELDRISPRSISRVLWRLAQTRIKTGP